MSDGIDEIVVVPGAFLDAMADGNFGSIGGLKDVSGEAIEKGCVGGSIVFAGTAEILIEMYFEHPMQAVLDLPMGSGEVERLLRRQKRGGHEQAHQRLGLIASAGDADESLVAGHQRLGRRHDLGLPPLVAAVAGLGPLGNGRGGIGQLQVGTAQPMTTIALQRKQVIATSLGNGRSHAGVAMERAGGDQSARKINEFDDFERGLDFVLTIARRDCRQAQPGLGGEGRHRQRRTGYQALLIGPPQSLAVKRHHLGRLLAGSGESCGKGSKGATEGLRVEQAQQPREGVVAGGCVIVDQPRQRLLALLREQGKFRRIAGAAQARRDHHHDQIAKPARGVGRAWIRHRAKVALKAGNGSRSFAQLPLQRILSQPNHSEWLHRPLFPSVQREELEKAPHLQRHDTTASTRICARRT